MATSGTDIYGRQQVQVGGVFLSDMAIMTISAGVNLGVGALVQSVEANYAQQANALFELGSNKVYQLMGRAMGVLSIGKIVSSVEFDSEFFDACKGGATVSFSGANGGCNGVTSNFNRTLSGVFISNYGFTMNTQELMIRENIQGMFSSMSASNQ